MANLQNTRNKQHVLNYPWVKNLFSREIRKYFEVNEKESTTKQQFVEQSVGAQNACLYLKKEAV